MIAVGLLALWVSYSLLLLGWTKIHQMPLTLMDLVIPGKYNACRWAADITQGQVNKATGCIESSSSSSGSSSGNQGTVQPGSNSGTPGTVNGIQVAAWFIPLINYAKTHGWSGTLTSGYRSFADQQRVCSTGVQPCATPGSSHHQGLVYPDGAIDVTDAAGFVSAVRGSGLLGASEIQAAGAKDPPHISIPGSHRAGEGTY